MHDPSMATLKSYRATFVSDDNESWVKDSLLKIITIAIMITTTLIRIITIIILLLITTRTTTTLTIKMTIIVVMVVQEAKLGAVTDEPSQQPLQHWQSSSSPFNQLERARRPTEAGSD